MIRTIIWDFDGVIINSNDIRELGFRETLKRYPKNDIDKLILFHRKNGGLSRYVKFRHFFENILNHQVTENKIQYLADIFSNIMLDKLTLRETLINETIDYIKKTHKDFHFHIASGSDEHELNQLCRHHNIKKYFKSIKGSPKTKIKLIQEIISINNYSKNSCLMIGDSINDLEAAEANNIGFLGYNIDNHLKEKKITQIRSFTNLDQLIKNFHKIT